MDRRPMSCGAKASADRLQLRNNIIPSRPTVAFQDHEKMVDVVLYSV